MLGTEVGVHSTIALTLPHPLSSDQRYPHRSKILSPDLPLIIAGHGGTNARLYSGAAWRMENCSVVQEPRKKTGQR